MVLMGIISGLVIGSLWSLLILSFINAVEKKTDRILNDICHLESRFETQVEAFYNIMEDLTGGENNG